MRTFARAAALLIAMVALAACTGEAPKPSSTSSDGGSWFDAPVSIPRFLNGYGFEGEPLNIYAITHLVVRGTYIPGTVRCTIQETLDQPTKRPPYHPQSSDSYGSVRYINCFADLRVNDYIVGTGSPKLTILVFRTRSTTTRADARAVRSSLDKTFIRGEWNTRVLYQAPDGGIEGREGIFFLGPTWDHSMKVLDSYGTWGVEQKDDGTVIAVHPQREHWSSWPNYEADFRHLVEIPLATFKTKVQEAHADRLAANGGRIGTATALPMLITDANNLAIYYTGDGYVDPPPPCGLAVPDQIATPQLLLDCIALLGAKDALRGTGTLNWSADKAITTWDGVSTNATGSEGAASGETGTATHVTKVELVNKGLTGSVPESLGKVERLTTLKLSGNTLTGCLPFRTARRCTERPLAARPEILRSWRAWAHHRGSNQDQHCPVLGNGRGRQHLPY